MPVSSPPSLTNPPPSPNRATDTQQEFSSKTNSFLAFIVTWVTELTSLGDWFESTANTVETDAQAAESAKLSAQTAEGNALGAANLQGRWSDASGAKSPPVSFEHNGTIWSLLVPLGNVALSEPSAGNTDWADVGSVGGTASNASALGGIPASQYFHEGHIPQISEVSGLQSHVNISGVNTLKYTTAGNQTRVIGKQSRVTRVVTIGEYGTLTLDHSTYSEDDIVEIYRLNISNADLTTIGNDGGVNILEPDGTAAATQTIYGVCKITLRRESTSWQVEEVI